jgi:hypothetical protein
LYYNRKIPDRKEVKEDQKEDKPFPMSLGGEPLLKTKSKKFIQPI